MRNYRTYYASWPYTFLVDYIFSTLPYNIICNTRPRRSLTYILFVHTRVGNS